MKKEESQPQSLMYPVSCAEACKLRGLCQHEAYSSLTLRLKRLTCLTCYFSAATNFVLAGNSTGHDALWRTTSALVGPQHELQL